MDRDRYMCSDTWKDRDAFVVFLHIIPWTDETVKLVAWSVHCYWRNLIGGEWATQPLHDEKFSQIISRH